MERKMWSRRVRCLALGLLGVATSLPTARAQEKVAAPVGGTVNVVVTPAVAPPPPASITLYERHGHATPIKGKCVHTGGGLIEVTSPSPDTVIFTMSGVVTGNADMRFDLEQCFEVSFDDPKLKHAKLALEGRVIGVLRGAKKACASYSDACAHVSCETAGLLSVCVPPHSTCGCENLSVNDHDGPKTVPVAPGKYTLNQTFVISAHGECPVVKCLKASAEFAPDPALDPLWISYREPFHGIKTETFGFQVILRVVPQTDAEAEAAKKPIELLPLPAPKK